MKLILPNGNKLELDTNLKYEEKKRIVEDIVNEWSIYFTTYRNVKTTVCLEVLSNYLCNHKEEQEGEIVVKEEVES